MDDSSDGFEQLDVRAKWKDEARDFTPWLAENIEVLGDALGMKLETVSDGVTDRPVLPGHPGERDRRGRSGSHREPIGRD